MTEHIQITAAGREVVEARRERDEALAEVKRLRAQLAEAREYAADLLARAPALLNADYAAVWDDGHDAGIDYTYGTYTKNPYRTQPEETQ